MPCFPDMGATGLASEMQGTSALDVLLAKCRDLASAGLDDALAAMLAAAEADLAEQATKTQDREQVQRLQEARDLART